MWHLEFFLIFFFGVRLRFFWKFFFLNFFFFDFSSSCFLDSQMQVDRGVYLWPGSQTPSPVRQKIQKVALRQNLKCGTQIFFDLFFFDLDFFRFFFEIFFFDFFFQFFLLVFLIVRCRLIGVSTCGMGARHTLPSEIENLESGTQKKYEMWHLDFFSNFFFF